MSLPPPELADWPEDLDPALERPFEALRFASTRPGPRIIMTAAVHGNETCGSFALAGLAREFESGQRRLLKGALTRVPVANPKAWRLRRRHGDRNLNRRLMPKTAPQQYEDHVANGLCPLLAEHEGLLDLHSFQSGDRPFALFGPANNRGDLEPFDRAQTEEALALRLGCDRFVFGWLDTYARGMARRADQLRAGLFGGLAVDVDSRYGIGTTEYMRSQGGWAITLECGQHEDPTARAVAYTAVINTLAHLGMIGEPDPAPVRDFEVMGLYEVFDRLHVDDRFERAWKSFDPVTRGAPIGVRADGTPVLAPDDGLIIFPNVKSQAGQEWFYLARRGGRLGR